MVDDEAELTKRDIQHLLLELAEAIAALQRMENRLRLWLRRSPS